MVNIVCLTIRNKKSSIEYSNPVNITMSGAAARTKFLKNNVGINRLKIGGLWMKKRGSIDR